MNGAITVEPGSPEDLAASLREANEAGLAVIPWGGGTKQGWGNPPTRADVVLSTAKLNRVVEHAWADLTVTVEAGCTVGRLQETLARHGQRLALDALWPEQATVGGVLSVNDSGAWRLRYGGLRDLIIGVRLALADGTLARSGGKVVKNVAGYDLPKLATGAFGTLGVIVEAVFRLHPVARQTRSLSIRLGSLAEMQGVMLAIQDSQLAHAALQARMARGATPELDILLEGTPAGIASQEAELRTLAGAREVLEAGLGVWLAREKLFELSGTIAKFSILPLEIAHVAAAIDLAFPEGWQTVVQANGTGYMQLSGGSRALLGIREKIESAGGSLTLLRQEPGEDRLDAWGSPSDTVAVMRAIKQQFDPKNTLNPGRFVGGI